MSAYTHELEERLESLFTEDVELKPHPNELESAVNGDHTVRFDYYNKDIKVTLALTGEPAGDLDEWIPKAEGQLNWTTFELERWAVISLAVGRIASITLVRNGTRVDISAEDVEVKS